MTISELRLPTGEPDLIDLIPVGISLVGPDGRILRVNLAAERLLGLGRREHEGRSLRDSSWSVIRRDGSRMPPEEFPATVALVEGRTVERDDVGIVRADGRLVWLDVSASPLPGGGVVVTWSDISERHLGGSLASAIGRIAIQSARVPIDGLLRAFLDEAEALTGSLIGFYHFLEEDQATIGLQAWSTRTEREFCRAEGKGRHYDLTSAGVWADAVRERRPLVHNDYPALPYRRGLPEGHAAVLRELVVPIFRNERIVAILGVGNKPTPYDGRDVDIVRRLADVSWDLVERRREQERAALGTAAFEASLAAIVVVDEKGTILRINDAFLELFGFRNRLEPLGRRFDDLLAYPEVARSIREAYVPSRRSRMLVKGRKVDGALIDVELSASPMVLPSGALERVVLTLVDVTGFVRAEEALRKSEERLRLLTESSRDIVFFFRLLPDRAFEYVSPSCLEITGWSAEEHYADPGLVEKLVHPDDRPAFAEMLEKPELLERPVRFRWVRRDGAVLRTELRSRAHKDLHGRVVAIHGVVRDVTDEERREEESLAGEARFRGAFEMASAGQAIVDGRSGRVLEANRRLCEMVGRTVAELRETGLDGIAQPDDAARLLEELRRLPAEEVERIELETGLLRKDGSLVRVRLEVRPLAGSEGAGRPLLVIVDEPAPR